MGIEDFSSWPERQPAGLRQMLALGDSYTVGESVPAEDSFPNLTISKLNSAGIQYAPPRVLAVTGWTTRQLLDAMARTEFHPPYYLISLLIGVNNQYQGLSPEIYAREFGELLDQAIMLAGRRPDHVFVLSVPDYSLAPFSYALDKMKIAAEIDSFNVINRRITGERQAVYVDITGISRDSAIDPEMFAGDGLHYSAKQHALWADRLADAIGKRAKT